MASDTPWSAVPREGVVGRCQLPQRARQLGPRGVQDGRVVQPRALLARRRPAQAVPGIEPDVVVVAAGRNKRRLVAEPLHDLKAQNVAVKAQEPCQCPSLANGRGRCASGRDYVRIGAEFRMPSIRPLFRYKYKHK